MANERKGFWAVPKFPKPTMTVLREDRGRMPDVILPSIPSRKRKHHQGSGANLLRSIQLFSGALIKIPPRDGRIRRRDIGIRRGTIRVRVIKRVDR